MEEFEKKLAELKSAVEGEVAKVEAEVAALVDKAKADAQGAVVELEGLVGEVKTKAEAIKANVELVVLTDVAAAKDRLAQVGTAVDSLIAKIKGLL